MVFSLGVHLQGSVSISITMATELGRFCHPGGQSPFLPPAESLTRIGATFLEVGRPLAARQTHSGPSCTPSIEIQVKVEYDSSENLTHQWKIWQ
jgi:hypothetical protein